MCNDGVGRKKKKRKHERKHVMSFGIVNYFKDICSMALVLVGGVVGGGGGGGGGGVSLVVEWLRVSGEDAGPGTQDCIELCQI